MPRIRKTKEEIKSFLAQYQQVFEYYTENKLEIPKHRLTSTISESLVAWLIEEKELLSKISLKYEQECYGILVFGQIVKEYDT